MPSRDDWNNPETDALADALLSLESTDEVKAFLRDLCTFNEITELAQRWQIARLLEDAAAYEEMANATNPYGDGLAAARIVAHCGGFDPGSGTSPTFAC